MSIYVVADRSTISETVREDPCDASHRPYRANNNLYKDRPRKRRGLVPGWENTGRQLSSNT